jgi:dolichol-phosphate mannosyltransferase
MKSLVVTPTFNEAGNIERLLDAVRAAAPDVHVLVVDDSSPDGTAALARGWGARHGGVDVLDRPPRSGLGSAYRDGFAWGLEQGFDALIEMDADLQHDPGALPTLLAEIADGAVLVIGSRYVEGGDAPKRGFVRDAISRLGNRYAVFVLRSPVRDLSSGYRAYAAAALRAVDLSTIRADGYAFQIEMAHRVMQTGGDAREVPIVFAPRTQGESKMSLRIVAEALVLVTAMAVRDRRSSRR